MVAAYPASSTAVSVSAGGSSDDATPLDAVTCLAPETKARLAAVGITALFPVQVQTVERVLAGQDVVVRSKTGSGKTLGFAIPIIDALLREGRPAPRARRGDGSGGGAAPRVLVLTPTRELAKQVEGEFARLASPGLRTLAMYGGTAFGPQAAELRSGVDIVVGTPGRVMDHLERGTLSLGSVTYAVLDEADEMLRMGFKQDVETIYAKLPPKEQR